MDNRTEIIREVKKVLEFYQALGFEYLPVKLENSFQNTERRTQNTENPPSPPFAKGGRGGFVSELQTQYAELNKESALKALREEIGDCKRCRLSGGRKNIVFGAGDPDAKIMFIGEGPGREEDIQAKPFVGDAGTVLTNLIKKMGLQRENVYIANVVKCRPPLNRDPEEDEIASCSPFLVRQIEIIMPRVIVALGRISAHYLTESKIPITRLRGAFHEYRGIPVMPTFHPAYLMRNPKDKWLTWGDAQKVLSMLRK